MNHKIDYLLWDGNNIASWVSNDGAFVDYRATAPYYGVGGLEWPKGSGKYADYSAGLWIVTGKVDGVEEIRTTCFSYTSEFVPGPYGSDPDSVLHRIYSISSVDDSSNKDWQEWPIELGAPWIDQNSDGVYNPNIDQPKISGDLFYWTVFNDGDSTSHSLFNTPPMGIEVQSSIFGFDSDYPLENVLFVQYLIINKGYHGLDSVYIGFWNDPDIGSTFGDLIGSDSTLGLGYAYDEADGDEVYGMTPPAVGTIVLQGPIVPSLGETARMFGRIIQNHKNLSMTSSMMITEFSPWWDPWEDPQQVYRAVQGLATWSWGGVNAGDPMINPITGNVTKWAFTGQPWIEEGWIDGIEYSSGERRQISSTGPFTLAQGDSQEVVMALILSKSNDPLSAIPILFDDVIQVYNAWNTGFIAVEKNIGESLVPSQFMLHQPYPNPFNPQTTIEFSIPQSGTVSLTIYDVLGRQVETILNEYRIVGHHNLQWNASDVPSGIYFVRMESGSFNQVKKVTVLR